jgi:hypothetical protein
MSNWRLKSSNKKFAHQQILKTDYSTNLERSKENDTIDSSITIENDETRKLLKDRKQTSTGKDSNLPTLRNFFCFGSSMTEKEKSSTYETSIGWEQILDREFQSLDIDADGYVSIADLQSVLK